MCLIYRESTFFCFNFNLFNFFIFFKIFTENDLMTFKSTKVVTECDHGWYELQWKILQRDFFEVRFLLLTLERFLIC